MVNVFRCNILKIVGGWYYIGSGIGWKGGYDNK